ncbi:putative zinc-finger [Prauserella aidingensis]|uniref:zf-HC2 domain-containing protein n=1 Tax=Prauserella aidingensis TaxID=387890 RepID=UPI0020A493C2|nr:zf-HC2 domain-containing protein [Prauserella aidingensis]MCP2255309.1 putative zinc-finger [Prauserella aidingensis]
MSRHHGSGGFALPESHLLPDAVVAFVDNELSTGATERAAEHLAHCPWCAAEVDAQRQVRSAVRDADEPSMSAGFLASLRSIPQDTELDQTPDNLAVTEDGQLVAVQRPDRVAGLRGRSVGGSEALGASAPLGGSTPLGQSGNVLGGGGSATGRRRAAQGAGVVVSGLVLSALALVTTTGGGTAADPERPRPGGDVNTNVLRAQFGGDGSAASRTATSTPTPTAARSTASAEATGPAASSAPLTPVSSGR